MVKGLQAEFVMANMSAEILRNIVASVLKVNARNVVLSGELDVNTVISDDQGHSWWNGASYCMENLYGFSSNKGLIKLDIIREYDWTNGHSSDTVHTDGETVANYLERTNQMEEFLFFVIIGNAKSYGESEEPYNYCKLFKCPNFKEYYNKLKQQDIARWEQWLNK